MSPRLWDLYSSLLPATASNHRCHPPLLCLPAGPGRRQRRSVLRQRHLDAQYHENVCLSRRDGCLRFVHRTSVKFSFPRQAPYRIRIAPLVISVLYRLECEPPDHGSSSPSVRRRHRYVPRIGSQRRSTHLTRLPAMGIAAVYTLSLIGTNTVFNNEQQRISNSFFSCTLALNTVCTGACLRLSSDVFSFLTGLSSGLIAFRIWRTQRQTRDAKMGTNLSHVAIIVVESGTFHSSTSFSLRL